MLAFLFGTLVTSILAIIFAVPLSIGIALFMTEVAPGWLKKPVVYVMDLLSWCHRSSSASGVCWCSPRRSRTSTRR